MRRGGSSTGVHGKSGCYREDQGPCLEAQGDFVSREMMGITGAINRFPPIINDVPPPPSPPLIINIPVGQKIFIISGEYLLKGFGRAAFKFLLKSIKNQIE